MSKQLDLGNKAEKELAKIFQENGFWAHILAKAKDGGQPFDLIAVKENAIWFLDSKHIEGKVSFPFSDIRPNQDMSMDYAIRFAKVNSSRVGFALFFENDANSPRYLPYTVYKQMANEGKKSINYNILQPLEEAIIMR